MDRDLVDKYRSELVKEALGVVAKYRPGSSLLSSMTKPTDKLLSRRTSGKSPKAQQSLADSWRSRLYDDLSSDTDEDEPVMTKTPGSVLKTPAGRGRSGTPGSVGSNSSRRSSSAPAKGAADMTSDDFPSASPMDSYTTNTRKYNAYLLEKKSEIEARLEALRQINRQEIVTRMRKETDCSPKSYLASLSSPKKGKRSPTKAQSGVLKSSGRADIQDQGKENQPLLPRKTSASPRSRQKMTVKETGTTPKSPREKLDEISLETPSPAGPRHLDTFLHRCAPFLNRLKTSGQAGPLLGSNVETDVKAPMIEAPDESGSDILSESASNAKRAWEEEFGKDISRSQEANHGNPILTNTVQSKVVSDLTSRVDEKVAALKTAAETVRNRSKSRSPQRRASKSKSKSPNRGVGAENPASVLSPGPGRTQHTQHHYSPLPYTPASQRKGTEAADKGASKVVQRSQMQQQLHNLLRNSDTRGSEPSGNDPTSRQEAMRALKEQQKDRENVLMRIHKELSKRDTSEKKEELKEEISSENPFSPTKTKLEIHEIVTSSSKQDFTSRWVAGAGDSSRATSPSNSASDMPKFEDAFPQFAKKDASGYGDEQSVTSTRSSRSQLSKYKEMAMESEKQIMRVKNEKRAREVEALKWAAKEKEATRLRKFNAALVIQCAYRSRLARNIVSKSKADVAKEMELLRAEWKKVEREKREVEAKRKAVEQVAMEMLERQMFNVTRQGVNLRADRETSEGVRSDVTKYDDALSSQRSSTSPDPMPTIPHRIVDLTVGSTTDDRSGDVTPVTSYPDGQTTSEGTSVMDEDAASAFYRGRQASVSRDPVPVRRRSLSAARDERKLTRANKAGSVSVDTGDQERMRRASDLRAVPVVAMPERSRECLLAAAVGFNVRRRMGSREVADKRREIFDIETMLADVEADGGDEPFAIQLRSQLRQSKSDLARILSTPRALRPADEHPPVRAQKAARRERTFLKAGEKKKAVSTVHSNKESKVKDTRKGKPPSFSRSREQPVPSSPRAAAAYPARLGKTTTPPRSPTPALLSSPRSTHRSNNEAKESHLLSPRETRRRSASVSSNTERSPSSHRHAEGLSSPPIRPMDGGVIHSPGFFVQVQGSSATTSDNDSTVPEKKDVVKRPYLKRKSVAVKPQPLKWQAKPMVDCRQNKSAAPKKAPKVPTNKIDLSHVKPKIDTRGTSGEDKKRVKKVSKSSGSKVDYSHVKSKVVSRGSSRSTTPVQQIVFNASDELGRVPSRPYSRSESRSASPNEVGDPSSASSRSGSNDIFYEAEEGSTIPSRAISEGASEQPTSIRQPMRSSRPEAAANIIRSHEVRRQDLIRLISSLASEMPKETTNLDAVFQDDPASEIPHLNANSKFFEVYDDNHFDEKLAMLDLPPRVESLTFRRVS